MSGFGLSHYMFPAQEDVEPEATLPLAVDVPGLELAGDESSEEETQKPSWYVAPSQEEE